MHTNTLEWAQFPTSTSMQFVVEVISPPQVPIGSNSTPAHAIPLFVNLPAIQVPRNPSVLSPKPFWGTIIMISFPHVPIRPHTLPTTLVVLVQRAESISVKTNTLEPSPSPGEASMQTMIVKVAVDTMPVPTNNHPFRTSPPLIDALAVPITADSLPCAPEPSRTLVEMLALPYVPIRPHSPPMALVISKQSSQTVSVNTDAPESTPNPSCAAMQVVVIMIFFVQMPVTTDNSPLHTSPLLENAVTVSMTTNSTPSAPAPSCWFVVMISLPKMPVGTHTTPLALDVTHQDPQAVPVHTDPSEAAPSPAGFTMQTMVEMISTIQVPIAAYNHPTRPGPPL